MKIADLLRRVADAVEQEQDPSQPDDRLQNPATLEPIKTGVAVDVPDNTQPYEDELMVPPLQLKMELLKRAVNVDNIYDPGKPRADEAHDNLDEIAILKQRAGIPVAAVMELGNDEIFDD